jgi:hypothetical protein
MVWNSNRRESGKSGPLLASGQRLAVLAPVLRRLDVLTGVPAGCGRPVGSRSLVMGASPILMVLRLDLLPSAPTASHGNSGTVGPFRSGWSSTTSAGSELASTPVILKRSRRPSMSVARLRSVTSLRPTPSSPTARRVIRSTGTTCGCLRMAATVAASALTSGIGIGTDPAQHSTATATTRRTASSATRGYRRTSSLGVTAPIDFAVCAACGTRRPTVTRPCPGSSARTSASKVAP